MTESGVVVPERYKRKLFYSKIEGVPGVKQKHTKTWCGYAGVSMMAQFEGFPEITQEAIFAHLNGDTYDFEVEDKDPRLAPDISLLAVAAREMSGGKLLGKIYDRDEYERLSELAGQAVEPSDILRYHIRRGRPCLIRIPRHYWLLTGMDFSEKIYYFNNPTHGKEQTESMDYTHLLWSRHDANFSNAEFLMLVLFRVDKK